MRNVDLNGCNIAYADEGSGPALIFFHGLGANHTSWDAQAVAFSAQYRVIRGDFRGFGASDKPRDPSAYSVSLFGEDMVALIGHLDIERVILIGTSMGGYMAQSIALKYPKRVERLVLCHTACSRRVPPDILKARLDTLEKSDMETYAALVAQQAVGRMASAEVIDRLRAMIAANDKAAYSKVIGGNALDFDVCDRLHEIDVPVLIIAGEEDRVVPPERSMELHKRIAGSRYEVIQGAGHLSYMECPDVFNGILRGFLQ